ncbi:N-acetylmuramoyl-L-alanine amidase family protein [Cohnella soli]|uniref:N-acetylmuramoyl-L-alanine amidase n=1 Tax=Cohnella soli TaxID=425005 RepID=A0ABW0I1D9_9BACL
MRKNIKRLAFIVAILAIAAVVLHNQVEGGVTGNKVSNAPEAENMRTAGDKGGSDKPPSTNESSGSLAGRTIVVDAGHGGKDVGSIGKNGLYEKDVTLPAVLELKRQLEDKGATVVLTRATDEKVQLEERVDVAADEAADLFISIHFDAFEDRGVKGMTTYYNKEEDKKFAELVHESLAKLDAKDRGVQFGDYFVLRENARPSILLELGYISNEQDEKRMQTDSFREQAAAAIVEGVIACLG